MPRIHKLPLHEAQKIAAGEVVERPANVVKELLENALDASATQITLYLEDAGKELIRIVDNGHGMSAEDARMCIEQHATSKIRCVEDLKSIASFGFRGEALASICAVSNVTIQSKEAETQEGIKLHVQAGTITDEQRVASITGTDITIRSLFYNVPARKKFLKKRETELNQIQHMIHAFCLQHKHIHFKCFHDGRLLFNYPPTDTVTIRFAQMWDHTIAQHMIPFEIQESHKKISLSGAISNHQHMRYDRSTIFVFVNKRWIKNYALTKAILKGYMNVLAPARYPTVHLDITLPTELVDINIHPRKEEVQFAHPHIVENLITTTIKKQLEEHLSKHLKKPVSFSATPSYMPSFALPPAQAILLPEQPGPLATPVEMGKNDSFISAFDFEQEVFQAQPATISLNKELIVPEQKRVLAQQLIAHEPHTPAQQESYQIIGQYNTTYILLEHHDGLFLIDQHAAHERILYELFSKRFHEVATISLLFPQTITLSPEQGALLAPYLSLFQDNGIDVSLVDSTQLHIHATPVHLKDISLIDLIQQLLGWITDYATLEPQDFKRTINEKLHAQMACKAAVKAGDVLSREHMQELINTLFITNNRFTCPHGRPTGWLLSLNEIEKRFKRKL